MVTLLSLCGNLLGVWCSGALLFHCDHFLGCILMDSPPSFVTSPHQMRGGQGAEEFLTNLSFQVFCLTEGKVSKNHPLVCSSNTCYQCEEHPPGSVIWCEAQQLLFLHFCLRFHLFLHTKLFFVTLSALFTISVTGTTGLTFIRITANLHHSFGSCRSVTSTILTICIWNKDINNRSLWNTSKSPNLQTKFCKY